MAVASELRFDELPDIQPFPQIAGQIVSACGTPSITAQTLCEIIQRDPGIALKIMKVANSSAYGLSGRVTNLSHAVVVLGLKSVRNLALSAAASSVFKSGNDTLRQDLWSHSVACATVASLVAQKSGLNRDDSFLAGIVHDAGKLLLMDAAGQQYLEITGDRSGPERLDAERIAFGTDHQELGLRCAEEWGLPLELSDAISNHHAEMDANFPPGVSDVVNVSNHLSKFWGLGVNQPKDVDVERVLYDAPLKVTVADLDELQDRSQGNYESVLASFQD
ncbi:MAG: HDOD domain-containing protein [Pirellulaceae bacterium]|nr:HDOD domain-containing protein [Planctomycetales bacterium]